VRRLIAGVVLLSATAIAALNWPQELAVRDSLRQVEPWFRLGWLTARGLRDEFRPPTFNPDTSGLRCVGRWSYGPSVKVMVRATPDDTLVCLTRGSGASLIRFRSQESLRLALLSDINSMGITSRAILHDTLVLIGCWQGGTGIEVWGAADPTAPHLLARVSLPPIADIAVQETLLYTIGYVQDSLRVFNIADPRNPVRVGACADSGFPICVAGSHVYLAEQHGLNIVDVSDPTSPHRVASIGGDQAISVTVRDSVCFFGTASSGLRIYNVRNPAAPAYIGSLPGIQPADLYLPPTCDTVLYTPVFHAVNIADLHNPRIIGQTSLPGWDYGVTAVPALGHALVADYFCGLGVVDLSNPGAPRLDMLTFSADMTEDVHVDGTLAYAASYMAAGMKILDASNVTALRTIADVDTPYSGSYCYSVTARDSFAYMSFYYPYLRVIDVTDPARPALAAAAVLYREPKDMVLRDSFLYVAEDYKFQIVNVARPREPQVVGTCNTTAGYYWGMQLQDSLAYLCSWDGLTIISVAQPTAPRLISQTSSPHSRVSSEGLAVHDTLAFIASYSETLWVYSVADPISPRLIAGASLGTGGWGYDADMLDDTTVVVGCRNFVKLVSVTDPAQPRVTASHPTPYWVRRVVSAPPYVYVACRDAGVMVLEATAGAIAEPRTGERRQAIRVSPTLTSGTLTVVSNGVNLLAASAVDIGGRVVANIATLPVVRIDLDISGLPDGVYLIRVRTTEGEETAKAVKTTRR
jgi:hypothetical protein